MKLWLRVLLLLVAVLSIGLGWMFWQHAEWRAALFIVGMQIREGNALVSGKRPGHFDFNTYTNRTHHQAIERIYTSACERLQSLGEGKPLTTYYHHDLEGWPSIITILQLPQSYFAVTIYQGNDSDGVAVHAEDGTFSVPVDGGRARRFAPLGSWQLPPEFINEAFWKKR